MPHLSTMQSGLALASLGGGAVLAVAASVLTGWHHRPAPTAPAAPADDLVWLACHNIACSAHMTTRHIPHDDGTATCQACGQVRRDHQ